MTGDISNAIEVENLHVTFTGAGGATLAVRDVSLSIASGEILGVVGESGSGKSALAMALLGLHPQRSCFVEARRIMIARQDLTKAGERDWRAVRGREIAWVPQDPSAALNPTLTIERQLWLLQRRLRDRPAAAAEAAKKLAAMGLAEPNRILRSYPHQLSGGQRQRVAIASALIQNPKVIVADEPTTALDVTVQAEILALLRRLAADIGVAILFITHNLAVAGVLCDRLIVMRRGVIVETGATAELLSGPQSAYARDLLAAIPSASAPRQKLPLAAEEVA